MITDDRDLKSPDIQVLSSRDSIAAFFSSLGYNTDDKSGARIKQSVSALGITPDTIAKTIKHVERLADQENGSLQVYLFELSSVTVAAIRALARTFRDRAGKYLLVLTSDYENIDFIFLERVLPSAKEGGIATKGVAIRPHILTVKRRDPGTLALRVLRRFTYTESDADAQADKLLSAFSVAEWSERLFNNRALFSDYYLKERLPQSSEWSEQIKPQLLKLRELFANVREKFGNQKEAIVREKLLQPVFELLGFTAITGKDSKSMDAEPDYRLYQRDADTSGKPLAVCLAYTWNRYLDGKDETRDAETPDENPGAHVVTLLEAGEASWAIVTNGKVWRLYSSKAHSRATNYYEIDLEETLAMQEPQEAFRFFWLLFREQAFAPVEEIQKGEKRATTFLDRLIEESEAYAKELGEKLKSRVFDDIFPHFAEGFIEHMGGAEHFLSLSDEERDQSLREVFQGTLTFLYRLLFLLYSESRNLLPVNEVRGYWDLSLSRIKKEIADHAGTIIDDAPEKIKKAYRQDSSELYKQLTKLFGVIDQGDADVNVPLYNGGLFITNPSKDDESPETRNARFLRTNKIPDRYLALGLDMMARDEDAKRHDLVSIDYKSLGVRHLGSIYEGLLEFKLRIATEKMAVVKGKKTEEVVAYKEAKKNELPIMTIGRGKNAEERVLKKGTVYLENDKRERKATGSYYTPDYIVKYIVENTVGPVLAEKLDALRPKLREAQLTLKKERDKYKALGGKGDTPENQTYLRHRQLVDDLFDIKVLDPAMGSGHFLVEAVDFISDKILGDKEGFLRAFPWNPITAELQNTRQTILNEMEKQGVSIDKNRLTDVNLLKRHILKRCIYGVDLNPMAVELAKVSLWLDCFTLGAPLSFLDHHLKCGNSLIGAKVEEVRAAVETGQLSLLGGTHFQGLLLATDLMRHIGELSDVTAEQVKNSRAEFKKAVDALAPFKRYMDVYTSQWFGNAVRTTGKGKGRTDVSPALEFLRSGDSEEWAKASNKFKLPTEWKGVAATALAAADEKRFFHWELEYPEIFYGHRPGTTQALERLDGAGFDAVIGNPPYVQLSMDEDLRSSLQKYLVTSYGSSMGRLNTFGFFIKKGLDLTENGHYTSMIVPNTLLTMSYYKDLRQKILRRAQIISLGVFEKGAFEEAVVENVVYVLKNDDRNLSAHEVEIHDMNDPWRSTKQPISIIAQEEFANTYDMVFNPNLSAFSISLKNKVLPWSEKVEDIANVNQAIALKHDRSAHLSRSCPTKQWKPVLDGGDIERFSIEFPGNYLKYDVSAIHSSKDEGIFLAKEKLMFRRVSDRLVVAYDNQQYYALNTLVVVTLKGKTKYNLLYIAALLNSKFLDYYYRLFLKSTKDVFSEIQARQFEQLPIRKIAFATDPGLRTSIAEKGRQLCMQDKNQSNALASYLDQHLSAKPETADVVHDLLVYLTQQMIDMNRERHAEIQRYLSWIEKMLKIESDSKGNEGINALAGKTALREYLGDYQKGEANVPFNALWDVLLKNKNRMRKPLDSVFQSRMREEHEKSLSVLLPIKQKLTATDMLIDQIVYRLYGLTDEEIATVEGTNVR